MKAECYVILVQCDGTRHDPRDPPHTEFTGLGAKKTWQKVREAGWSRSGYRHMLCPDCTKNPAGCLAPRVPKTS